MSILDKHPWPWRLDADQIVDAQEEDGTRRGLVVGETLTIDPSALPLILCAPELLAALKALVEHEKTMTNWSYERQAAEDIISRIEKGDG